MISYPETEQFRSVIKKVKKRWTTYEQYVDRGFPRMTFVGTVKLHGSNGSFVFNKDKGFWCQSRNNTLLSGRDNAGFAAQMNPVMKKFFDENVLAESEQIQKFYEQGETIVIYGEWCGGNIQKGVAISGLPKMFVIFKVAIVNHTGKNGQDDNDDEKDDDDEEERADDEQTEETETSGKGRFWLEPRYWSHIHAHSLSIYNIYEFPNFKIEIDFHSPESSQNRLVQITEEVERQCPVGAAFNVKGIGEGVVWTEWQLSRGSLTFKVKGEKHSVSKVKTLAPVDVEKLRNVDEFVQYCCTENRMKQGLDYLREQGLNFNMKNFRTFLDWLIADINKEEKDTMVASGVKPKDAMSRIAAKAKSWYQAHI